MARFQLEIAITLIGFSAASLLFLVLRRSKEGKIQLPSHVTEDAPDPFDITTPEDFIEGYPIDEENFWRKLRIRKGLLCLLLVAAFALQSVQLGLSVANKHGDLAVCIMSVCFDVYLVVLAARAIRQDTVESHSRSIVHLVVLLSIASVTLGFSAILPNSPPIVALEYSENDTTRLWYATVSLYIAACFIAYTTPRGPTLYFPYSSIYSDKVISARTNTEKENVTGVFGASPWDYIFFSYSTKVVMLGNTAESLEIADLPIVPANMRATVNYYGMKTAIRKFKLRIGSWKPKAGSGWNVGYTLIRYNLWIIVAQFFIAVASAILFYAPALFSQMLIAYLEADPERKDRGWGWVYVVAMFISNIAVFFTSAQLWSISTTTLQTRFRIQLNTILFAKTLIRKDSVSSAPPKKEKDQDGNDVESTNKSDDHENDFSSKAQIMTLMTTDTDRLSEFAWHFFALVDSPIELVVGSIFLYKLLGVSCFFGLAVTCLFLPMNHFAGKVVVSAQDNLMKARDERIALMNEILGGIRMLKFMAWERSFEARVMKIRVRELKYQRLNYIIETCFNAIWNASPILVTLVSFWHFAVVRGEDLTPSIAFTSIMVFSELKFALNALPETFINMLQGLVSLRRIDKYLNTTEVSPVPPLSEQPKIIAFQSCTATWPQDRNGGGSTDTSLPSSVASTPRQKFILIDLNLKFPDGELSLVCGKLGSGKTLLLLALLGEADILAGQMFCPRSPPNIMTSFTTVGPEENWIIQGVCAYVPQSAWLRNASIKDNILFNLPYDEKRYQKTLEVCALVADMEILEDGDESEIGERGVNLSGGQKARVSLARAVYSRASILLLDDVLSAVDAHTAHHLYHECLKGELMNGRTVVLVSHHVQLCAPGASYIVALDNGRVSFQGSQEAFRSSDVIRSLVQSTINETDNEKEEQAIEELPSISLSSRSSDSEGPNSETVTIAAVPATSPKADKKPARKLVEEETRAVGRVSRAVWLTYVRACGPYWYWILFGIIFVLGALSPVAENGWLKVWSGSVLDQDHQKGPTYYIGIYALITAIGLVITTTRWLVLYGGSIHASTILYQRLLETVLFANMRFHDTISRGRLLNRFGKDFEGIDSSLSDNFGRSIQYALSAIATIVSISVVGGPPFVVAALLLGVVYWNVAKIYGQTSRDMRRLDSVTRSPLYSINGETIAGVTIIRAFGASSKFLRDMLRCLDTNANPYYWMWGVNRWLSIRFNVLSSCILGAIACIAVVNPAISASLAGFSIAFANTVTNDLLFMVRRFVGLEQSMVALERVKEFSELKREPPEFIEPRPPASWPATGAIKCENLVIRYAPELPNVLHKLNFEISPGEKVGILGRTGSGKSTLALSFFRFVEATEGRILVDDRDIASVGLTDLRSRLTIIPQDPTILSGTLRSTLDVFDEYEDAEIFEALRRVHLIPSSDTPAEDAATVNANIFRNLDSSVSEGGDNFSTGEKQLLCMARAILKRSKILVMDEATASVDYATDELISKTIRQNFADSTIMTIAHRLRTVIDYDRIMLLSDGRIVEFDKPTVLLADSSSKFHALCKATGKEEFATLKKLAGL